MPGINRAVFLDRDGTICEDPGYLAKPEQVKLLPGSADAIARLRKAGFCVILVTNQSAIARGLMTEADLAKVHERLGQLLAEANPDSKLDGIYYCPYHPQATVAAYKQENYLRKPRPGMLFKAAREFQLDLGSCWMAGDSERDVQAGKTAGCRAIRLASDPETDTMADRVLSSLAAAADFILASPGRAPLRPRGGGATAAAGSPDDSAVGEPKAETVAQGEAAAVASASGDGEPAKPEAESAELFAAKADEPAAAAKTEADLAANAEATPATAAGSDTPGPAASSTPVAPPPVPSALPPAPPTPADEDVAHAARPLGQTKQRLLQEIEKEHHTHMPPSSEKPEASASPAGSPKRPLNTGDMRHVLAEILQQLRQVNRVGSKNEISATKILGGLFQMLAWGAFACGLYRMWESPDIKSLIWLAAAIFLQLASLTFFMMHRQE